MPRRARMKPGRRRGRSPAVMTGAEFARIRVHVLDWTQARLAEEMGHTSVTISNLERGASPVTASYKSHLMSIVATESARKQREALAALARPAEEEVVP